MQELDEREALAKRRAVANHDLDLAYVGKHARGDDLALPAEIRKLPGERRFEIATGATEIRISLELSFGHDGLREHRGSRRLLRANHRLQTLMVQPEQAEQRYPEDRNRDHHFEQRKSWCAAAEQIHLVTVIPAGITSPLTIATWPVSGEISSVITSPDASSRWTTVAST